MKKNWLIIAIVLIALFLRLFHLTDLFYFAMDEELIAFRSWGLFELNRPFLIGAASPLQFHLPPYFFYLSAFLLAPFKFNPAGWGISGAILGVLTTYGLYRLSKKISNHSTGLIASVLYAVSFTAVFFDRHYWPMSLSPLLIVAVLLLLTKVTLKKFWPYLAVAGLLALGLSADPSNLPLALSLLTVLVINRIKFNLKFTLVAVLSLIGLFFTPLLIFDLRHQGANFAGVSRFFSHVSDKQFDWSSIINAVLLLPRSFVRFWYSPQTNLLEIHGYCIPFASARQNQLPLVLVILACILLFLFIIRTIKSKSLLFQATGFLVIFYFLGIILFGSLNFPIFDHYLTGLLPVFSLITAMFLIKLPKFLRLLLIIIFVATNLWQISRAQNSYGLKFKQELVTWANSELTGQDFALDSISKCHRENGLRYLFELSGNPPAVSFMDPNFFWLYRNTPREIITEKVLVVTDKPLNTLLPVLNSASFGAMNVYLLDNSSQTYDLKL